MIGPRHTSLLLVLFAAVVAAGCGGDDDARTSTSSTICTVYDQRVTKADLRAEADKARRSFEYRSTPFPKSSSKEYRTLREQWIDFLVQRRITEHEAEKLDVKVTKAQVERRLDETVRTYFAGKRSAYAAQLEREGLTLDDTRAAIRDQLLTEGILAALRDDVDISEAELRRAWKTRSAQYDTPRSRTVAVILVKTKTDANRLLERVQDATGEAFEREASTTSLENGPARKGTAITFFEGRTNPALDDATFDLAPGEISRPIETDAGWYVVRAIGATQPARAATWDDARDELADDLLQERLSAGNRDWNADARARAAKAVDCVDGTTWSPKPR